MMFPPRAGRPDRPQWCEEEGGGEGGKQGVWSPRGRSVSGRGLLCRGGNRGVLSRGGTRDDTKELSITENISTKVAVEIVEESKV